MTYHVFTLAFAAAYLAVTEISMYTFGNSSIKMAASQEEKTAHKVMRRGTRACRECRRRKIKCLYDEGRDDICQECLTHERQCIKQGLVRGGSSGQSSRSVKVQVARLESAVQKLAREKATIGRIYDTVQIEEQINGTAETQEDHLAVLEQDFKKRSPIFSLFDNDTLQQNGIQEAYNNEMKTSLEFSDPNMSDRDKLLSTIANVPNILEVLQFACDWWLSWSSQHFALRGNPGAKGLRAFVESKIGAKDCINVAMGLLAIAVALGQLRIGIDDQAFNLPLPATQIMNYILTAVDQIVCDSRKYQNDPNMILLFIMRAKHHTENNQLRKAWVRIRQGIHCAQDLGFGASPPTNGSVPNDFAEQQRFIASIFEIDHVMSMILGYPHYAKEAAFTDARAFGVLLNPAIEDESLKMRALRRIIAIMAGHINDRNTSGEIVDELTEGSQQTLELAASQMPPNWWHLLEQPMFDVAQHRYESLMVQMWYWTVQSYLNLPYLIEPRDTPAGIKFRRLCLDATRNLIRTFNYLRTEPSVAIYMCNCDDFQGLLGACILLVGILQDAQQASTPRAHSPDEYPAVDVDADLALIDELKQLFSYRMQEQGGGISKQGLQVLNSLTSFIYADEEEVEPEGDQSEQFLSGMGIDINKRQKTIMLPYFGTINIELTKKIPRRNTQDNARNRLPTPPYSDGYPSDYSMCNETDMSMFKQTDFVDPNFVGTNNTANGHVWPVDTNSSFSSRYSPESEPSIPRQNCVKYPRLDYGLAPVSWDSWGNYMVDQELTNEWNPGLPYPVVDGVTACQ